MADLLSPPPPKTLSTQRPRQRGRLAQLGVTRFSAETQEGHGHQQPQDDPTPRLSLPPVSFPRTQGPNAEPFKAPCHLGVPDRPSRA